MEHIDESFVTEHFAVFLRMQPCLCSLTSGHLKITLRRQLGVIRMIFERAQMSAACPDVAWDAH